MISADFEIPAGPLILVGDTRPRDYFEVFLEDSRRIAGAVFESVARERPTALLHLGDLAVFGAAERFWQGWTAFDRDIRPVVEAGVPIYPTPGNHEYRGPTRRALRPYFRRFPHLDGRRWYTLRSGGLLFIVLDANFKKLGPRLVEEQDRRLRSVLSDLLDDERTRLAFALVHEPPYTNISPRYFVSESAEVRRRWVPLFTAHPKLAAVFSGHVHAFEHFLVDGTHFVVSGGGGSPRFHLRPKERRRNVDLFPDDGSTLRPFHYLRLAEVRDGAASSAKVEVVALKDDEWFVPYSFEVRAPVRGVPAR